MDGTLRDVSVAVCESLVLSAWAAWKDYISQYRLNGKYGPFFCFLNLYRILNVYRNCLNSGRVKAHVHSAVSSANRALEKLWVSCMKQLCWGWTVKLSLRCQCHIFCHGANSHDYTVPESLKKTQLALIQDGGCFSNWLSQGYCREWLDKMYHTSVWRQRTQRALKVFLHRGPVESCNDWTSTVQTAILNTWSWHLDFCHAYYLPGRLSLSEKVSFGGLCPLKAVSSFSSNQLLKYCP